MKLEEAGSISQVGSHESMPETRGVWYGPSDRFTDSEVHTQNATFKAIKSHVVDGNIT